MKQEDRSGPLLYKETEFHGSSYQHGVSAAMQKLTGISGYFQRKQLPLFAFKSVVDVINMTFRICIDTSIHAALIQNRCSRFSVLPFQHTEGYVETSFSIPRGTLKLVSAYRGVR